MPREEPSVVAGNPSAGPRRRTNLPCKEVPYKPISASEKAALANWQDQEGGNGHHDMHMGDNVVVISQTSTNPDVSLTSASCHYSYAELRHPISTHLMQI